MPTPLRSVYPWTCSPLIVGAPMRLIALAPLAVAISRAGGLGFLAAGTDVGDLNEELQKVTDLLHKSPIKGADRAVLPIGVGFINWGLELDTALAAFKDHTPAAVWFFAPKQNKDLEEWTTAIRSKSGGKTKIWIQVGSVSDAVEMADLCRPDVLVIQGADAGGHGLAQNAGIVSLFPEVSDTLEENGAKDIALIAAGGIVEGRGIAACLVLGAAGVALGTRFLASTEANIAKGYQDHVLRIKDGGVSTTRTDVYDKLRGTTGWPNKFNGRGIINQSHVDAQNGKPTQENKQLYEEALQKGDHGWGHEGRLTTYAGSAVGMVRDVMSANDIVEELKREAVEVLSKLSNVSSKL